MTDNYIQALLQANDTHLILEDGSVFSGRGFGHIADNDSTGEVVFNTSMTGYQEIVTDPSYCKQMITMTYPLIGNYGVNAEDMEAITSHATALIVKECCEHPSNWRSLETIDSFLKEHQVVGLSGIDTRMLTRKIRLHGTMRGLITRNHDYDIDKICQQLKDNDEPTEQVPETTCKNIQRIPCSGHRVALIDMGCKASIQKELVERNCDVTVVPYNTSAEKIFRMNVAGVLISNGPGDPKSRLDTANIVKQFFGKIPVFGICMGHQIIALAAGAETEKLKFGHRGANHPVKDLNTGKVYITSQNHGYTVSRKSLAGTVLHVSHVSLNDDTVEGLKDEQGMIASVQYHPEAAPGPLDSRYLFDQFIQMIEQHRGI